VRLNLSEEKFLMPPANGHNGNSGLPHPNFVPIQGNWEIGAGSEIFTGGEKDEPGIAASSAVLQNGACRVRIRFSQAFSEPQAAGLVVGYRSVGQHFILAALGGAQTAYSIIEYASGSPKRALIATGARENLRADQNYLLELRIQGQELRMLIDDVQVFQHLLSLPLEGKQVGLFAEGRGAITFSDFEVKAHRPRAFVAMQFSEPFDTFYREVILPQAEHAGFQVVRIDEKDGPGVIFQDMQREIEQAGIVIAEISPANTNVFYELGYAHALGKPTILLARRGSDLPFDIRSYRVVFYNDTIGGKPEVERSLREHLESISNQ
jgi:hypothetical protein